MRHRFIGIGIVVVVAAVLAMAAPAGAATAPSRLAIAFWQTGDAQNTNVSVQATEQPGQGSSLFLFVTQRWCDTATDEMVFRSFSASPALAAQQFLALPNLKGARLDVATTVNGTEQRLGPCSSPSGSPSQTSLGSSSVHVVASWTGVGAVYTVQPGIVGRTANATGSITGDVLSPGSLGSASFAELRQVSSS
jgi:hypothetical protein